MRILVVNTHIPFIRGGAELLADGLVRELNAAGHQAEIVRIPFKWYPPERILDSALASSLLDLSAFGDSIDLCIGLKYPAYLVQHPNLAIWLLHQHRQAYDLWDTEYSDIRPHFRGLAVREAIKASDEAAFRSARVVCTISDNVTRRLANFNGIAAKTLYHPPPLASSLRCDGYEDFLFFPSRVSSIKRQALVLEALACTRLPIRCVFAGAADNADDGHRFTQRISDLGLGDRVQWLGGVDSQVLIDHYARCKAVIFTPLDEDYGYVTLEAMLARKAVITLTDSGGPAEFVVDGETGRMAQPTIDALAAALDEMWSDSQSLKRMGRNAYDRYHALNISWSTVIDALVP